MNKYEIVSIEPLASILPGPLSIVLLSSQINRQIDQFILKHSPCSLREFWFQGRFNTHDSTGMSAALFGENWHHEGFPVVSITTSCSRITSISFARANPDCMSGHPLCLGRWALGGTAYSDS